MIVLSLVISAFGVLLILLATVGLLRFPDVYMRSHAAGKAATVGVCSVLLGAALGLGDTGTLARAGLAMLFLLVGIPVAAQLVTRAAFRNGALPAPETRIDPHLCTLAEMEATGRNAPGEGVEAEDGTNSPRSS